MHNIQRTLIVLLLCSNYSAGAADTILRAELAKTEKKCPSAAATVDLYHQSYALVIANQHYTDGWVDAPFAIRNGQAISAVLEARGFAVESHVDLVSDQFATTIEEFLTNRPGDAYTRILIWYSGNSTTLEDGAYLLPVDAPGEENTSFKSTALSMRAFGGLLRSSPAQHIFSVFDSCLSSTLYQSQRRPPAERLLISMTQPVRKFLTSCEQYQENANTMFTDLFINTIEGGGNYRLVSRFQ